MVTQESNWNDNSLAARRSNHRVLSNAAVAFPGLEMKFERARGSKGSGFNPTSKWTAIVSKW